MTCSTLGCEAAADHDAAPMTLTLIALLPALLGFAGLQSSASQAQVRSMTIEQQLIIRVPVRPRRLPQPIEWIEKKGPKCIPTDEIRGAMLSGPDHVDFLMIDQQRFRAKLDSDCPALDFYGRFYLSPEDDRVCAGRDAIRSRIGGDCTIDKFRRLEPRARR